MQPALPADSKTAVSAEMCVCQRLCWLLHSLASWVAPTSGIPLLRVEFAVSLVHRCTDHPSCLAWRHPARQLVEFDQMDLFTCTGHAMQPDYISQRSLPSHLHVLPGVQRRALPGISISALKRWVANAAVYRITRAKSLYTLLLKIQI